MKEEILDYLLADLSLSFDDIVTIVEFHFPEKKEGIIEDFTHVFAEEG